jgi:hypothetical protein
MQSTESKKGGDVMAKKFAFVSALSLMIMLAMAPLAHARRGHDDPPQPPECQIEDGGVLVCK